MAKIREKQAHLWERDEYDWYVEPRECSRALFAVEAFSGVIWDPACGSGRIVEQATSLGLKAVGTDVVRRSDICSARLDFLKDNPDFKFDNIVTNPPFSEAERFVRRALKIVPEGGKIAAILPIVWLTGFSTKRDWLPGSPLRKVFPLSPRPSMPPGRVIEAGERPGNGTKDYCWLLWQVGYTGGAEVVFLNTSKAREEIASLESEGRYESAFKW